MFRTWPELLPRARQTRPRPQPRWRRASRRACVRTTTGLSPGHRSDSLATEVADSGYENLSIRDVARRAGVAAATAYTYGMRRRMERSVSGQRLPGHYRIGGGPVPPR